MSQHGWILAVTDELAGDFLEEAAAIGATTLQLEDSTPFEEDGGTLIIGGDDEEGEASTEETVDYTAADYDLGTLTLATGLVGAHPVGAQVLVDPPREDRWAYGQLEDPDITEPVRARVPYTMKAQLPLGPRSTVAGADETETTRQPEEAVFELDRGEWHVRDLLGATVIFDPTYIDADEHAILFPEGGIEMVTVLPTLPDDGYPEGDFVFLNSGTDTAGLYRSTGTEWTDDDVLAELNVSKLRTGTMNAAVVLAGSIRVGDVAGWRVDLDGAEDDLIASDAFARADGALGSAETGQAWTATGWEILTQEATRRNSTSHQFAHLDTGLVNGIVEADVRLTSTNDNDRGGLVVRSNADATQCLYAAINRSATGSDFIRLVRNNAGIHTTVTEVQPDTAIGADHHMTVLLLGDLVVVYLDGIAQLTYVLTDADVTAGLRANTRHGLYIRNAASEATARSFLDDFTFNDPAYPLAYHDGTNKRFLVDRDGNLVAVGSFQNSLEAPMWRMTSGFESNEMHGHLGTKFRPGRIAILEEFAGEGVLALSPPNEYTDAFGRPQLELQSHAGAGQNENRIILRGGGISATVASQMWVGADEIMLLTGHQARGRCAMTGWNDAGALRRMGCGVTYGGVTRTQNVPSSITTSSDGNADSAGIDSIVVVRITNRGFVFDIRITATSGTSTASRNYVTVGN